MGAPKLRGTLLEYYKGYIGFRVLGLWFLYIRGPYSEVYIGVPPASGNDQICVCIYPHLPARKAVPCRS